MTCTRSAGALEVREEVVTEPDSLARALDQPGDVGDGELGAGRRLDRPEHGLEGRERVVGDLRGRVRDPAEKRRLARVRHTRERSIGDELEPELQSPVASGEPGLGEPRRLSGRGRELRVPAASGAATGGDEPRARPVEVGNELAALVEELRADRELEHDRGAVGTVLAGAAPVAAALGLERDPSAQHGEIAQIGVRDDDDVAAPAAVTAIGPTLGDELLPAEAQPAVAATTGADSDAGAIVEHR